MNKAKILQTDYLDILFTNRNKEYGSYELRKHYNKRALKAMSVMLAALLLAIGIPFIIGKLKPERTDHSIPVRETTFILSNVDLGKPKDIPKIPELPGKQSGPIAKTFKNTVPKIITNEAVKPELKPPTFDELADSHSGPVNHEGAEGGTEIALTENAEGHGKGSGEVPGAGTVGNHVVEKETGPRDFVEEMPEFPGGYPAMVAFISKNLKYPLMALEAGIEGKVFIKFVVGTDGRIESAKVIRGLGGGCDREALRVVNTMPKWKPGRQNGHAVKVYFTLPIHFMLRH